MAIELSKRYEIKILTVCMVLLAAAAAWLLLTRPTHRIEGDFLQREDERNAKDGWLAQQMRSSIAEHRARACLALGRIGDQDTLDLLLRALEDPIARVRAAAAFALGLMQDRERLAQAGWRPNPRVASALLAALGDEDRVVATRAVEALGRLRWRPAFPAITETPAPLPFTMTALVRLGDRAAVPWIAARRRSDDQDTRWAAAMALNELGAEIDEEITRSFVNLTKDTNLWVRMAAVRGLGSAQTSDEVVGVLAAMTEDRDPKVRIEALRAFGKHSSADVLPVLVKGLGDPLENVRVAAVQAIGTAGDPEAIPLLQSLRFEATPAAYEAEQALAKLARNDEEFFAGLGEELPAAYRTPQGFQSFVQALRIYRSEQSVEWLQRLWESGPQYASWARAPILRALAEHRAAELPEYLAEAVKDSDFGVRIAALELLANPNPAICRRAYDDGLAQSVTALRLAALDAVTRSKQVPQQKRLLLDALEDSARLVRARAVSHLRLLYGENHDAKIGPAQTRYLPEDYQRIARTIGWTLTMETSVGELEIALDYDNAALTSESFLELARQGYFDGQWFIEAAAAEFVKAGDPRGDGRGGPGYALRSEYNTQPFLRGSLGMVEDGPDSAGSQFFICLSPEPLWDGRYTNFGRLVSGDDVLDRITVEARILKVRAP